MAKKQEELVPVDTAELYEIREIGADDLRQDADRLIQAHYQEIALNKSVMVLDPDWKQYYALEEQHRLAVLGAFYGCELVGYSVNFVARHMHYQGMAFMANDVLFMANEHRATGVGAQLIDRTIELARMLSCEMITFHAKPGTALCRMLGGNDWMCTTDGKAGSLGFQVQDIVFSKVLV